MADDYYALIGMPRSSTDREIWLAYQEWARSPQRDDGTAAASIRAGKVQAAWVTLAKPDSRREWEKRNPVVDPNAPLSSVGKRTPIRSDSPHTVVPIHHFAALLGGSVGIFVAQLVILAIGAALWHPFRGLLFGVLAFVLVVGLAFLVAAPSKSGASIGIGLLAIETIGLVIAVFLPADTDHVPVPYLVAFLSVLALCIPLGIVARRLNFEVRMARWARQWQKLQDDVDSNTGARIYQVVQFARAGRNVNVQLRELNGDGTLRPFVLTGFPAPRVWIGLTSDNVLLGIVAEIARPAYLRAMAQNPDLA